MGTRRSTGGVSAAMVALLLGGGPSAAAPRDLDDIYVQPRLFTSIEEPQHLLSADLNHDGRPDVIVSNVAEMQSWLRLENGTFELAQRGEFGAGGILRLGRVGTDRHLDLVHSGLTNDVFTLYEGRGDGTFARTAEFAWGVHADFMEFVDLNHDDLDDLVITQVTGGDPPQVQVRLGQRDATFTAPRLIPADGTRVPTVVDLNGDSNPDLMFHRSGHGTQVAWGVGDGTFLDPVVTELDRMTDLDLKAVADVDGDGHLDQVLYDEIKTDELYVALGQGEGQFGDPVLIGAYEFLRSVCGADLDGDGRSEVLVAFDEPQQRGTLAVLRWTEDGGVALVDEEDIEVWAHDFVIADFTGDDHVDVMTGHAFPPVVVLLEGEGDGRLLTTSAKYLTGDEPLLIQVADLNGDGARDLVSFVLNPASLAVILNAGKDEPALPLLLPLDDPDLFLRELAVAETDGDGVPDLVYKLRTFDPEFLVRRGLGGGRFADPVPLTGLPPGRTFSTFANVFSDGIDDVIELDSTANQLNVYRALGAGAYQLDGAIELPCPVDHGALMDDLNGDGAIDVIFACEEDGTLGLLLARGDGTFDASLIDIPFDDPIRIVAGDVDGDGIRDLVLVRPAINHQFSALVLRGTASGAFVPGPIVFAPYGESFIGLSDVDHDGQAEFGLLTVFSIDEPGTRWFRLGELMPDGSLVRSRATPLGEFTSAPFFADVDGNGAADLVYGRDNDAKVGSPDQVDFISILFNQHTTCAADLDGSAVVDLADLQLVLGAWGACDVWCAPDFDGDGVIGHPDVITLLGQWGPCPGR